MKKQTRITYLEDPKTKEWINKHVPIQGFSNFIRNANKEKIERIKSEVKK